MYHCCLAYRHVNGEIEGFHVTRFDETRAREATIADIKRKLDIAMLPPFDPARLIESKMGLSAAEYEQCKRDWGIIEHVG